jgi:hypothetical protein
MNNPKRIIWFSERHAPAPVQVRELDRLFPGCTIIRVTNTWGSVDALIDKYNELQGDEMVAVLPLSIVRLLTMRGQSILWSFMTQTQDDDYDIVDSTNGRMRRYKFECFKRLKKVKMMFEEINPESESEITKEQEEEEECAVS